MEAIGRIGKDAEGRMRDDGSVAVNFSIATVERWKNKEGVQMERTTWVDCVLWRTRDTLKILNFLLKGAMVRVEGVPSVHAWMDKQNNTPRANLTLRIDKILFLSSVKKEEVNPAAAVPGTIASDVESAGLATSDSSVVAGQEKDDLPF